MRTIAGTIFWLTVLVIGIGFLGGIVAIAKGCEVLNENIAKWN